MSLYSIEFDPRALDGATRLPPRLRCRLREDLEHLRADPFRSHPGVQVKEIRELRGVWRFHLGRRTRAFYVTIEDRLIVVMVDPSARVTPRTLAELRRLLRPSPSGPEATPGRLPTLPPGVPPIALRD